MSKMGADSFSSQTNVWPLVILRIGIGCLFLKAGWPKLSFMLGNGKLAGILNGWVSGMPAQWYPWYRHLLVSNIIPHADIFAYLVVLGEIAVGIALIAGFMTRPALLGALLMNLNYYLSSGYQNGASGVVNVIFMLAELALLFTPVGRSFGVDYFLSKKYPRIPLW